MHPNAQTEAPENPRHNLRNIKDVLPFLQEFFGRVVFALCCLLLAKSANVGIPLALKGIVDALDASKNSTVVLPIVLLLAYGLLRVASSLFNELRDSVFARVRYRAIRRLSTQLMQHLFNMSLRFHLERRTGAITRDLERGTRSVSTLLNYLTFSILPTLVEFALVGGILFTSYDLTFAAITFVTVAVYFIYTFAMSDWRMHYRHTMNRLESESNMQAIDGLINYETVKYFGNERYEHQRYDQTLAEWEDNAVNSQTSMSALNFGQGLIIAVGVTLIMIAAAQGVTEGRMSLGDLVLVNAYLLQLFIPLGFLGIVYRQTLHALADMDHMFQLLRRTPEIQDLADAPQLRANHGAIRFEQLDFHYSPDRPILHDISFDIAPGEKLAVVGHSGAGKSTLVRLLFRFYEPTRGAIHIDGQDISKVTQNSLRQAIGIVPQDTVLFNNSILYNIAYARPDATRAQVEDAARMAHIHDFITALPQGYDTVVGERGLKLSGGEKQRVAIARVVLKNPRILIFDEATSALDTKSEQAILAALREVAVNHTTLVIAHRLSTVIDADTILVMDNGRIIEQGTHQKLLATGGSYANMWELQQKENRKNRKEDLRGSP